MMPDPIPFLVQAPQVTVRALPIPEARHPRLRRLAFWVPVLTLTALGAWLAALLMAGSTAWVRVPLTALVAASLFYQLVSGWPAILGALLRLFRRQVRVCAQPDGSSRTAVLMPIHNEDVTQVFAAVETMARAVAQAGLSGVDFFVLSDTSDPAIAAQEEAAYAALQWRMPTGSHQGPNLVYRRRLDRQRRKVGNVAEFCERWGGEYDYMLVLDADSLMGADTIRTLIGVMDANPRAGIVQTIPYPVGRDTLFARAQQFAARLYTPLLVEGLHYWQGGDGNYWGHNAILRIRPFMDHCEMPVLPGREPFGGEILCHDVVEAGLMRRAGWDVWVLPEALESFEALPANMVDHALRERRWCQGNLQHLGVLPMPGLRPVGRYHLALGVAHYLAGPLTALFALGVTLDAALGGTAARSLLLGPDEGQGAAWLGLLLITLGALYGAKLAALAWALWDGADAQDYGGRGRLLASAVAEQVGAFVLAPVMLLFYARYLAMMVLGVSVRWDAQPRDDRGVSWQEATRCLGWASVAGAAWAVVLLGLGTDLLAWGAPLFAGLLLAVPTAVLSSRATLGRAARRAGLFLTVDETDPAPILRAYRRQIAAPLDDLPGPKGMAGPILVMPAGTGEGN